LIDTAAESPNDIFPNLDGPIAASNRQVPLVYRSLQVFVSEKTS
jgi:isoamylase